MRTRNEHLNLASEIETIRGLLSNLPEDHALERIGLERRLEELTQQVSRTPRTRLARPLRVTFRGKPVIASSGFFADFASDAVGRLTDAVKAAVAGLRGGLKYMGPIPGASSANLMITGVARGSFGFEFEVPPNEEGQESLFDSLNDTEVAIDKVRQLIDVAATNDDDDVLADVVDEIHPRAVKKVKEFLDVLSERGALCAMEFNDRSFRFVSREQLDLGRNRLDDANIHETEQAFEGEIQGVLPKARTFEFAVAADEQVLRVKAGNEIEDPDELNRNYLHKPVRLTLQVTRVGHGRPRYVLRSLPELLEETDG